MFILKPTDFLAFTKLFLVVESYFIADDILPIDCDRYLLYTPS